MARRVRSITIGSHPSLYSKMEELRKMYQDQAGIKLSQMEATNILSKRINMPTKINLFGGKDVKKKR